MTRRMKERRHSLSSDSGDNTDDGNDETEIQHVRCSCSCVPVSFVAQPGGGASVLVPLFVFDDAGSVVVM